MYVVIHPTDSGEDLYLFFHADPRAQGCKHSGREGVDLHELPVNNDDWILDDAELGESRPFVLGQSQRASTEFRVCRSELKVPMNFDIVTNAVEVWSSWAALSD